MIYLPALAINIELSKLELGIEAAKYSDRDYLKLAALGDQNRDALKSDEDKSIYNYDYKSPKKAFLYSLLVPGWGQKYAGSHIAKPIFFLATEVTSWAFYLKYHNDGNKKTDEFRAFADLYWIEGENAPDGHSYRDWLIDTIDVPYDTGQGFIEKLPNGKNQQYYEMIGKYDQFRAGWDDYWTADSIQYNKGVSSPHRERYNVIRKNANDALTKANKFMIVALVNHVLSAFDAAISAHRHNQNKSGDNWLTVRAELKRYSATEEVPILKLAYKF